MSMSALVRALGAAAGGVSDGLKAADEKKRRDQRDQWEAEDRAFNMSERARALRMRDETAAAAAPVAVQQVEPAGPVMPGAEGAAGQPLAPIPTVQGKGYDNQAAADKAAADANGPQAVATRMADVAQRNGDPVRAQQLRTGAVQEHMARLTLNEAERASLDRDFNDDLQSKVNSWETLDDFVSTSAGDGRGGALKIQSVVSPDGQKRVVNVVQPDGTLKPTGREFPNSPAGLDMAMASIARIPWQQKLAHRHGQAVLARQAERDAATAKHQADVLAETKRRNLSMEDIYRDKTATQLTMAELRGSKGGTLDRMSEVDKMTYGDLNKQLEFINSERVKAAGDPMWNPKSPGAMELNKREKTLEVKKIALLSKYQEKGSAAASTDPLSLNKPGGGGGSTVVTPAEQGAADAKAGRLIITNELGGDMARVSAEIAALQQGLKGQGPADAKAPIRQRLRALQTALADSAKPQPATNTPPSRQGPTTLSELITGRPTATAQPADAQAQPGLMSRLASGAAKFFDDSAASGAQYEAIKRRVADADSGGKPLTTQERQAARAAGIAPIR